MGFFVQMFFDFLITYEFFVFYSACRYKGEFRTLINKHGFCVFYIRFGKQLQN